MFNNGGIKISIMRNMTKGVDEILRCIHVNCIIDYLFSKYRIVCFDYGNHEQMINYLIDEGILSNDCMGNGDRCIKLKSCNGVLRDEIENFK